MGCSLPAKRDTEQYTETTRPSVQECAAPCSFWARERFLQALAHRLPRYTLHTARFHDLVLKQLQRPVGITLGKVAPLYSYKVRFGFSVVDPAFAGPGQRPQHSSGSLKCLLLLT